RLTLYFPSVGASHFPPMKLSYRGWTDTTLPDCPGGTYFTVPLLAFGFTGHRQPTHARLTGYSAQSPRSRSITAANDLMPATAVTFCSAHRRAGLGMLTAMTTWQQQRNRTRIEVHGTVQGVGFRPFVYRLATHLGIEGDVHNDAGHVVVRATGEADPLSEF